MKEYEIGNKKLISFNDFNKEGRTREAIKFLKEGKDIALCSDSGTPGISVPGFYLVREAVKYDIEVSPIPGACAFVSALVCSGLPTDKFLFNGFLPQKAGKRRRALQEALQQNITAVFYESPFRIIKTLEALVDLEPSRRIFLGRELTKLHEDSLCGSTEEIFSELKTRKAIKGEFVLIIGTAV